MKNVRIVFRSSSLDLIQWLLQHNVRVDESELHSTLSTWMSSVSTNDRLHLSEQLIQMFVGDLVQLDADIDVQMLAGVWSYCNSPKCQDILLGHFAKAIQRMSMPARRRFVRQIIDPSDSAVVFLRKIELCRASASLDNAAALDDFCKEYGDLVLHYVAGVFGSHVAHSDLALWTRIGVTAMQNGADPVVAHDYDLGSRRNVRHTPLLRLLSMTRTLASDCLSFKRMPVELDLWIQMLQEAGMDMEKYFSRETEAWQFADTVVTKHFGRMQHITMRDITMRFISVEYDTQTQNCTFQVRDEALVPLKRLHRLPGSFAGESLVPDTMCWLPNDDESEEGLWLGEESDYLPLVSQVLTLQELVESRLGPYHGLIDCTQDDNGVLMRVLDKSYHNSRQRSSSQPCSIYRRRYDCENSHGSRVHDWLPPLHFCIGMSTWVITEHQETRECARGDGTVWAPAWDAGQFHRTGFLNRARLCQLVFREELTSEERLHDCTQRCPQGCAGINLNHLVMRPIPRSLPIWHPGRYGPISWWPTAEELQDFDDNGD